ncbi:MAG TPA: PaaI family thioesterase [Pedobacter sp.]|jgi:acyl-coenzyme A thioesterase 13
MEQPEIHERLLFLRAFTGKEIVGSPSGYMNWLKPVVVSAEPGALTFSYKIRREMTNPSGTLHGGVTAGIIDDLIGATVYTLGLSEAYTTINNSIDYFAPAKESDLIIAQTSIVKRGRSIINLQCEIWLPEKKRLIAKGYSNMLKLG